MNNDPKRKPLPVLGEAIDDQIRDYELDGATDSEVPLRKWKCKYMGVCSREMGSLPLFVPNEKGKRKPLIGWKCATDCEGFEARSKEEDRLDRDGLGRLASAILEEHPEFIENRRKQNKAREKLRQDRMAEYGESGDEEDEEFEIKKKAKRKKYTRVENVLDDVVDEKTRRQAIVDLRFNKHSSYGRRPDVGPLIDPEKLDKVRKLIVEYSEESLKPTSKVPVLKTLETMTPEERAEMERLYAPMSKEVKARTEKYDRQTFGAVDRLMKKGK